MCSYLTFIFFLFSDLSLKMTSYNTPFISIMTIIIYFLIDYLFSPLKYKTHEGRAISVLFMTLYLITSSAPST